MSAEVKGRLPWLKATIKVSLGIREAADVTVCKLGIVMTIDLEFSPSAIRVLEGNIVISGVFPFSDNARPYHEYRHLTCPVPHSSPVLA
jgi:hypothetical protein